MVSFDIFTLSLSTPDMLNAILIRKKSSAMSFTDYCKLTGRVLLTLAMFLIVACESGKKRAGEASQEFNQAAEDLLQTVEKTVYNIPPPSDIPYMIQNTGADFNPNIVNAADKYESYLVDNKKAAFNLGIYATDIGYLSSYGKTQEALNYMDVCLKLAEGIGVQDAVDFDVLERFERNLSNTDSLAGIIDEVIENSEEYLHKGDRTNLAAFVLGGTFVEGLYVATQIIDTYPKDLLPDDMRLTILSPIVLELAKQKEPLGDLIKLLESIEQKDDWVNATINSLKELYQNYESFDPYKRIQDGQANEVLNDEVLASLTRQVDTIRSNIVY
jgi:hypothetical protein